MKFSKKLLSCLLGASMLSGAVFADDFGFDDGGSGFGDSGDFSEMVKQSWKAVSM